MIIVLVALIVVFAVIVKYFDLDRKQSIAVALYLLLCWCAVVTSPLVGQLLAILI